MGTPHSRRHYKGVYECGIYCNNNLEPGQDGITFELKAANQHWCRCHVCTRVREKHEREMKKTAALNHQRPSRPERRRQAEIKARQIDLRLGRRLKDGWKPCRRCGVLTPNYFGLCRSCNEHLGDICDIDSIVTWNSGGAIRRRGAGTICRIGGRVY